MSGVVDRRTRASRVVALAVLLWPIDGVAAAQDDPQELEALETRDEDVAEFELEEATLRNSVAIGAAYAYHILRDRTDPETGEELGHSEQLFGFVLTYSRHLIPERLLIALSKPFLFNRERIDTPFDVILQALYRWDRWEIFAGLLVTWNIRIFESEREAKEGEKNALSLGLGPVIGTSYSINTRWSVELEVGYVYVPTKDIVTHEINTALHAAYHYGSVLDRRRARRGSR